MISNQQIKQNYLRVVEICKRINDHLDRGFVVFDDDGELVDSRWRFKCVEPDWKNLKDHTWWEEVTLRVADNCVCGYFDPDQSWKDTKAYWSKWTAVPPGERVRFV
jgi:hypothetical protein